MQVWSVAHISTVVEMEDLVISYSEMEEGGGALMLIVT